MTPLETALHLLTLEGDYRDPNAERSHVTGRTHALQAATRALRARANDHEIVAALLHDAARPLSDEYHGEVMSWILRGRVADEVANALYHHGAFQADIMHGTTYAEQHRERSWYPTAKRLAVWDAQSFDPGYATLPLSEFMPALERVLIGWERVSEIETLLAANVAEVTA